MCLANEEAKNHLLIHCQFARRVWNTVFDRFVLLWVMQKTLSELFLQWKLKELGSNITFCGSFLFCSHLEDLVGAK